MLNKDNFVKYTVIMAMKSNKKGKKALHCFYFEFSSQI